MIAGSCNIHKTEAVISRNLHKLHQMPYRNRSNSDEFIVDCADGILEFFDIDADDDVELARALVDHAHVDARFVEGGEDLGGVAGGGDHAAPDDGDEAESVEPAHG